MARFSVSTQLSEMLEGDIRLDATYYGSAVYQARKFLEDFKETGGQVGTIEAMSDGTFNPPPIKRVYTDNDEIGTPYMLPQEMFDFYWSPKKYVLKDKMPDIDDWFLKRGWVVLTQSGSVGKPYFATKADEKNVLSQNAIRIPLKDSAEGGFLYAYLSTWIGQTLLKKDEFGITVKHIRPQHVDRIDVPMIDAELRKQVGEKVEEAFNLRAKAIALLDEAKAAIYEAISAPDACPVLGEAEED